jgi:nicotinamidase-related amidase
VRGGEALEISNPVLVVVDVQNGFINEHSRHAIPAIASLIPRCVKKGIPVLLTKFVNHENSPFDRLIGWLDFRTRPETDLHEEISAPDALVIEKHIYTALTDEFLRLADSSRWHTIIICGISTESCILKTAVDAFEKGFRPLVIADACASNLGAEVHKKGLEILEVMIGEKQLSTTRDLLAALDTDSDTKRKEN